MSRIGRKPLEIPKGVTVSITKDAVSAKGPKGTLNMKRHRDIEVKQAKAEDGKDVVVFERKGEQGPQRAAHGLMRALVGNMLTGVTKGFERQLEINGVGYKAELKGSEIVLSLGFSHPINYKLPDGITAKVDKNLLILRGSTSRVCTSPPKTGKFWRFCVRRPAAMQAEYIRHPSQGDSTDHEL